MVKNLQKFQFTFIPRGPVCTSEIKSLNHCISLEIKRCEKSFVLQMFGWIQNGFSASLIVLAQFLMKIFTLWAITLVNPINVKNIDVGKTEATYTKGK